MIMPYIISDDTLWWKFVFVIFSAHWFSPQNPSWETSLELIQGVIDNLSQSSCEKNSVCVVPLDNDSSDTHLRPDYVRVMEKFPSHNSCFHSYFNQYFSSFSRVMWELNPEQQCVMNSWMILLFINDTRMDTASMDTYRKPNMDLSKAKTTQHTWT